MRGLGSSIYPRNVAYDNFGEVHWVVPAEAVWSCRQLAASHYAIGGWSVGPVAMVAGWLARTLPADTRIAAIFPDGPQRYLVTVYDDYCAAHGWLDSPPAPEPEVIGRLNEKEVTRWTRCESVMDPLTLADSEPRSDMAGPLDAYGAEAGASAGRDATEQLDDIDVLAEDNR